MDKFENKYILIYINIIHNIIIINKIDVTHFYFSVCLV